MPSVVERPSLALTMGRQREPSRSNVSLSTFLLPRCQIRREPTYSLVVDDLTDGCQSSGVWSSAEENDTADLDQAP